MNLTLNLSKQMPTKCSRNHSHSNEIFQCLNTVFTFTISSNERRTRFAGNSSLASHKQLKLTMTTIQNTVANFMFADFRLVVVVRNENQCVQQIFTNCS